jgi:hypothetical protein
MHWEENEEKSPEPAPLKKASALDKEVTLKFNARKTLKYTIVVVVVLLVFFLGRLSVGDSSNAGFSFGSFFDGSDKDVEAGDVDSGDDVEADETESEEVTPPEEEVPEPVVEPKVAEEPPVVEENEEIISDYSAVTVDINDAKIDWKETWGKITDIDYTITNGAGGSIKVDYFILTLPSYEDLEKKMVLPESKKLIKSKTKLSSLVKVPNGFGYRESVTGALSSVPVSLTLFDGFGVQVATVTKSLNLQG